MINNQTNIKKRYLHAYKNGVYYRTRKNHCERMITTYGKTEQTAGTVQSEL